MNLFNLSKRSVGLSKAVKKRIKRKQGAVTSPVVHVRRIPRPLDLILYVRAGGRCEFDGCNRYLLRHHVTQREGNFGEKAHIVAFRSSGPRGLEGSRPKRINDVSNLMLLCPTCHKLVDNSPEDFTRRTLEEYKSSHEKRIAYVTDLGPDRQTTVLVMKSKIGGQHVEIPFSQIFEATAPRYPSNRQPSEIDLSGIADTNPSFIDAAKAEVSRKVSAFFENGGAGYRAEHISVFALAPIPLLIFLGTRLSNKVPMDVYQRHRDTEDWAWKKTGKPVRYSVRKRIVRKGKSVALLLSLSGTIPLSSLPESTRKKSTIYEITLEGITPKPTYLRQRKDLEDFRSAYQEAMGLILQEHGLVDFIQLFPAVPAPIAVLCGRELLPKTHPRLHVYDYDKAKGGFNLELKI